MAAETKQDLLKRIPPITELLKDPAVVAWLKTHPLPLVTDCLRGATAAVREELLADASGLFGPEQVTTEVLLARAAARLEQATTPRLRAAINATGIILHTGLGRAVFPVSVVASMLLDLDGYTTLAVDRQSGERIERDELIEYILTELTGAEAATVVNNNAAATMLVLAALAAEKEVIVSRGQLIEIGGSFRLPEVMAQSRARLVEVGRDQPHPPQGLSEGHHRRHRGHHAGASQQLPRRRLHQRSAAPRPGRAGPPPGLAPD